MSVPGPALSHLLSDAISRHAAVGRTALIGSDRSLTYAQLGDLIDRYAAGFRAWTNVRGALIGIRAPKRPETVAAFFGAMQSGACPCIIEPRLPVDAVAERLEAAGARHLVLGGDEAMPVEPLARSGVEVRRLDALAGATGYRCPDLRAEDRAMALFTSGSTGRPKGILLSHANLACNARGVIERTGITPEDRLLHVMPHFHTNGINNQLIAPLIAGASIVIVEKFRAEAVVDLVRRFAVTYATGVPTMFARILASTPGPHPPESLRFLRCGSAPLTTALHQEIEEAFGVPLSVSYGLSEATCTSTMNPPFDRRVGTVGLALQDQTVGLLEPGSDRATPRGSEGEVCIAGGAVMRGYIEDGVERTFAGTWLRTGDLGTLDSDGYLAITGRIKDIIVRGGENLSPGMIERALQSHPAVQACSVVGAADRDLGEVPIAFVVRHDGLRVTERDLRDHVLGRLSHVHVPAGFLFLDEIPENAVGKADYRALKEMALSMR